MLTLFNHILHKHVLLASRLLKLVLIAIKTLCRLLLLSLSDNWSLCFWDHRLFNGNSLSWRPLALLNINILIRNIRKRIQLFRLLSLSLNSWIGLFLFLSKPKIDIDRPSMLNLSFHNWHPQLLVLYQRIPFARDLVPNNFSIFIFLKFLVSYQIGLIFLRFDTLAEVMTSQIRGFN